MDSLASLKKKNRPEYVTALANILRSSQKLDCAKFSLKGMQTGPLVTAVHFSLPGLPVVDHVQSQG